MNRPVNPFRLGSITFDVMEMALQGEFDNLPGTDDLTVADIAEVFGVGRASISCAIVSIKKRTGYIVPYIKMSGGRKKLEW